MVVGGNPRRKNFWEPILNKLRAKLSAWKGRFLALAGRICLIKSIFTALPLFYLSSYKVPESVYKSIVSIQWRFLWGWGKDSRTISWGSWEQLCKTRGEEGLGFKDIQSFNYALLAKWKWRLESEEKGKWKEIITSKYGVEQGKSHTHTKYQLWWWKYISKVCGDGD